MFLITTPRTLDRFAGFYHQLGQMLQAGIGLPNAIETLRDAAGTRSFRRPLTTVLAELQRGGSLGDALAGTRRWLPGFDVALLAAGEQGGRLDECCQILSDYYRERAGSVREIIHQMGWTILTIFVAFIIFPVQSLVNLVLKGEVAGFLIPKLTGLAMVAVPLWFFLYLGQARRGEKWRAILEAAMLPIPVLGKARQAIALARATLALETLLNAGVNVVAAWEMAADASGSPRLRRGIRQARARMEGGATSSEAIAASRVFPEEFVSYYASGEQSGRLDQNLEYLRRHYQDEARRLVRSISVWIPRILYLVMLVVIGMSVIGFWTGYYDNLLNNN